MGVLPKQYPKSTVLTQPFASDIEPVQNQHHDTVCATTPATLVDIALKSCDRRARLTICRSIARLSEI